MLVAIEENGAVELVTRQTHEAEFHQWSRNLSQSDSQRIHAALNEYIDDQGNGEIVTSSWVPGADWTDTPYEPIYQAVGRSWEMARLFFGLIVWNVFLQRPETWSFGRYPRNPGETIGMTYFRVEMPTFQVSRS